MKRILAIAVLVTAFPAQAQDVDPAVQTPWGTLSSQGLLKYCTSESARDAAFCLGYMAAMSNSMGIAGTFLKSPAGKKAGLKLVATCPKSNTKVDADIRLFVEYMQTRSTAEQREAETALTVMDALQEAHPCP